MWCSSAGRDLLPTPVLYFQWLDRLHTAEWNVSCVLFVTSLNICTRRIVTVALTHTRTQFLWVHLYCSHDHQHDLHDRLREITVLLRLCSNISPYRIISSTNFNAQFNNTCMSHYYPRHVSDLDMPILRKNNCTNTTSGILALELSERSYIKLVQGLQ